LFLNVVATEEKGNNDVFSKTNKYRTYHSNFLLSSILRADVKLPAIISDNMVLQADINVPVWGWADPNELITVCIDSQTHKTYADHNGKWAIRLNPLVKTNKPLEMTLRGKNSIVIRNILVGQVWLGSGQSNMEMPLLGVNDANDEIKNACCPSIRLFTVKKTISGKPLEDCIGQWVECSPETIAHFSAVLYYFGREINKELNQPVGLIHASWGGTAVETWTSESALKDEPVSAEILQKWYDDLKTYPLAHDAYEQALVRWENDIIKLRAENKALPSKPLKPSCGIDDYHQPSVLFNAMINPVIPFGMKGVVWYQGESNADRGWQYRNLFPLMIKDWRNRWQQGIFPFYFVQIANFKAIPTWPEPQWAELRQAQFETLKSSKNIGMAVTIDIGESNDIHPKNKKEVGRRLSLIARAKSYGEDIEYSGPIYKNCRFDVNSAVLEFDHCDGGLISKHGPLKEFAVAGSDRVFYAAQASINPDGKSIKVSSPVVFRPVAVRYAWRNDPNLSNLCNALGLPASPFKTDDWSGLQETSEYSAYWKIRCTSRCKRRRNYESPFSPKRCVTKTYHIIG